MHPDEEPTKHDDPTAGDAVPDDDAEGTPPEDDDDKEDDDAPRD